MNLGKRIEERLNELKWGRSKLYELVPELSPAALSALIKRDSKRCELDVKIAKALGWPYGITSASVLIRKHPQHGSDVIIALSDGQILCNAYDNCTISIRFDDRKPIKFTASTPADHSSKTLFLPAAPFVREAKTAQRMKISVPLYQNGEIMFDFDISGLEWPPKVASKTAAR